LLEDCGIFIGSHVLGIGSAVVREKNKINKLISNLSKQRDNGIYSLSEKADKSEVRIIDSLVEKKAINEIRKAKKAGDTLGGLFEILVSGVPIGLGSYVQFDRKLDGLLAQALMSIQAIKGVEIGDGFENASKFGSEVHDEFLLENKEIKRKTNRAGGIEGGMSNGEMIIIRAAMKPIATLAKPLNSIDLSTGKIVKSRYERSDVCAVPAASVIGESVITPVIANAFLEKFGGDSLKVIKKSLRN
jgi:chorismate synthase